MKRLIAFFSAAVFLFCAQQTVQAGISEIKKIEDATNILTEIMAIPEKGIPPYLLRNAQAIAIIPGVLKVGFVIGGRHGRGLLLVRTEKGGWSNPSFITLTGGSFGWQAGAQSTDVILVFKNKESIRRIAKGGFTLGADASVAAGPIGRHAEAGTDVRLSMEVYSYSRSRGLFAGIALEGAALQIDDVSNADLYGRDEVSFNDIVYGREIKPPVQAGKLVDTLSRFSSAPKREQD